MAGWAEEMFSACPGQHSAVGREISMRNPFRKKSTLEKTVEELEKTVEDPPRALKSGLAAVGIIAGILLVSAAASRARNGQEEDE